MNSTVIVIDDDEDHATLLSEILENIGKKVEGVGHNGKDAAALFDKYRPDYVIIDIMMPEFDGFFAIEEIRKKDPQAKIIVITGDLSEESQMKLRLLDVPVVYKPYDLATIENIF